MTHLEKELAAVQFYQVATSNADRARAIQSALPGGQSLHMPLQADEDRSKTLRGDMPVSLDRALDEVKNIAEGKARMDWKVIGGSRGAVQQIEWTGRSPKVVDGFKELVRVYSDSVQFVILENGQVLVLNKPTSRQLREVPNLFSRRESGVATAITRVRASLDQPDVEEDLATAIFLTRYANTEITMRAYVDFVKQHGVENIKSKAGGLPVRASPFIDQSKPVMVTISGPIGEGHDILIPGEKWNEPQRANSLHGVFPGAIAELLASPGQPISPNGGVLFKK